MLRGHLLWFAAPREVIRFLGFGFVGIESSF